MKFYRLLKLIGPIHILAGLMLTSFPFFSKIHQQSIEQIFGTDVSAYPTIFLLSVFGPTIASWGVLFTAVVNQYFKSPTQSTWNVLLVSVLIWVVLDTALCGYYNIYLGVGLNLAVAVIVIYLLFAAKQLIHSGNPTVGKV